MVYVARSTAWIQDTDPGGMLVGNAWSKTEANRQEANAADANARLAVLESLTVSSTTIDLIVSLTQAAYDAIVTKDARTLYVIS